MVIEAIGLSAGSLKSPAREHAASAAQSLFQRSHQIESSSGLVAEQFLQVAEKCVKHLLRRRLHESRTHCRDQPADLTV
jgi:hypothetical protein